MAAAGEEGAESERASSKGQGPGGAADEEVEEEAFLEAERGDRRAERGARPRGTKDGGAAKGEDADGRGELRQITTSRARRRKPVTFLYKDIKSPC
jgi:hypothetical protein